MWTFCRTLILEVNYQELGSPTKVNNSLLKKITFLAPDEAANQAQECGLFIVEEAGAIPVQVLQAIINNYNRIVFSTTIDGYEGNGQGFEVRFKKHLNERFPQWKFCHLDTPLRWSKNDILEKAVNDSFLLALKLDDDQSLLLKVKSGANIKFSILSKSILHSNETLLRQVYGLLLCAHYQTRPSDLERILGDESYKVFVATYRNKVLATALISVEGEFTERESVKIEQQQYRLAGHLIPQSLLSYKGCMQAGMLSYWRIMRIAVLPKLQRTKLGSRLIRFIEEEAVNDDVDILGASLALSNDVIKFWFSVDFQITRIGLKNDSSSGLHSGEFLKLVNSENENSKAVFDFAIKYFNESFLYNVSSSLLGMPTSTLCIIMAKQNNFNIPSFSEQQLIQFEKDAKRYTEKARSLEMVEWSLFNFVKHKLSIENGNKSTLSQKNTELIFAKLIQRKNWEEIELIFGFKGKKESRENTRLAILELI